MRNSNPAIRSPRNDAAFSLHRVVKLNKTPGFIITQFGFSPDNVEKKIRALDDYTLEMKLPTRRRQPASCCTASLPMSAAWSTKAAMANQANGDLGNAWLKTPHGRRRRLQADVDGRRATT